MNAGVKKLSDAEEWKGLRRIFKPLILLWRWFAGLIKRGWYALSVRVHRLFRRKGVKQGKLSRRRRGELLFFLALIAYPMAQFLVFYVYVNINSVLLAFKQYDSATSTFRWLGFDNIKTFLHDVVRDSSMITATLNSLKLYACTLLIALPLNLVFSYFLYKKVPLHGFFRVILFLPQIISSLVVSLMFRYFVEAGLPTLLNGRNLLQSLKTGFPTMIFYCIWSSFGTQILVYTSAMTKIDDSLVEFGKLEGISVWREFWSVVLPLIFPTITIFLVAGVAGLFTNQASLFNFYGSGARSDMQTLGYVFFIKIIKSESASYAQYPYASAAGLTFTLVATPVTLLVKYCLERFGPREE